MEFSLSTEAHAAGHRLIARDSVGSTMVEARDAVRSGGLGPLWVVARMQTAGRGRRGNAWANPPGNLAASLVWPLSDAVTPTAAATLGFVAGVAMRNALRRVVGPEAASRFTLKWPNDVLADGAKLVGILLELDSFAQGKAVVAGFGVNVVQAPTGLPYRAASLHGLGYPVTAEDLFTALTATWLRAVWTWDEGRGFACVRKAWLRDAAGLGGPVAVSAGDGLARGTFETIDEAGRLVIRGADGATRLVTAGEVHFGAAATAA